MSLISNLTSAATGALGGNYGDIVAKVQTALKSGMSPQSPIGQEVVALIKKTFPQIQGKANIVQMIDDLIPDALQSRFGFTPEVMTFIKKALGEGSSGPTAGK